MVKKKKASKRLSLRFKKGMEKKVANHHRKLRKVAKLKGLTKRKKIKKDPGIPNLWPFKEQLLGQIAEQRQHAADEKARAKIQRRKQAEKRRREEMVRKAPMRATEVKVPTGDQPQGNDSFFVGQVQLKEQGAVKRHWYYKELNKVVAASDVILEVLDARDPLGCRALDVESSVLKMQNPDGSAAKKIILILNKIDLVPSEVVGRWIRYLRRFFPTLAFKASTQQQRRGMHHLQTKTEDVTDAQLALKSCIGAGQLLGLLKNYARTGAGSKKTISVGVIGFPNVGKSSIINSLKRSRAVAVGATPGLTKSVQQVRLDKSITLIDSPGVLFGSQEDKTLVLRNCLRVEQLEDPIAAVSTILERVHVEKLMVLYRISRFSSVEEFLVLLANKLGKLGKGGIPNLKLAARHLLQDWNSGKIPFYTLPPVVEDVTSSEIVSAFGKEFNIEEYEEQTSASLMDLKTHQQSHPIREASYVVLEHGQSQQGSLAESNIDMKDDTEGDFETGAMDDEIKQSGTTQGVKKIALRDAQSNRDIRLRQKKLKKKQRKAQKARMQFMQDDMEDEADVDVVEQPVQQSTNVQVSDDYDFATDWS